MSKAILISIKPQFVAEILNRRKTLEIRKTAPKAWADYLSSKSFGKPTPIDVYIYCTKAKNKRKFTKIIPPCVARRTEEAAKTLEENGCTPPYRMIIGRHCFSDGKVVAKFRLKKAEEFVYGNAVESVEKECVEAKLNHRDFDQLLKQAAMTREQLEAYAPAYFYAWEISDLEIFDEPKPLSDFGLKRAPQSWQYVEVKE